MTAKSEFDAAQESGKKPSLKSAKPISSRKVVADCDIGDLLEFPAGPPMIHHNLHDHELAPSSVARVTAHLCGHVFVRFQLPDGKWTEMMRPDQNAAIARKDGYR